ncbi:MAG: DNA polymerase/3'-5' exonuclease PolX [Alkalispirochaetaceae bacterium]
MPVHNKEISRLLNETADLLDIKGSNEFRVRAYRNAARSVESLPRPAAEMVAEGEDLSKEQGIGKSLSEKIEEIVETGRLSQLEELKEQLPPGLLTLLDIPELGPRRAGQLYNELGVDGLDSLKKAIHEGKLPQLEGFGEKLTESIRKRLEEAKQQQGEERMLLSEAEEIAEGLVTYLENSSDVERIEVAGSYRRRKERVGDLDILVIASQPAELMERFTTYDLVEQVLSKGETRSSVLLRGGKQVDLRLLSPENYGSALIYFTGSKEHNIALRSLAQQKGYKVSEYGIFEGEIRKAGEEEEGAYALLGLPWIPPELRENRGEIEAAENGALPNLLELSEIKGDLHAHTDWSDGSASLSEMARAAREHGYEYLAVTDHSPGLTVANGLSEERLSKQIDRIAELNDGFTDFRLLASMEVNIELDGSLDLSEELLSQLDLVVCSIHSNMNRDRDEQTERLIRAMDNRYCTIIGHPTGRRFDARRGYDLDFPRLIEAARERNVAFEINAQPERLDLSDSYARQAAEGGVMIAISTDAHSPRHLAFMRYGVGQARRGWLEAKSVLNTLGVEELLAAIKR